MGRLLGTCQTGVLVPWYHYDMQFRQLRESISLRWDKIHYDLWVPAATYSFQGHMKPKCQFNQDITRENSYPFLGNVCWAFNRSGKCIKKDCKYIHKCRGCRGPHPAIQCSLSQGSTGPNNTRGAQGRGVSQQVASRKMGYIPRVESIYGCSWLIRFWGNI